MKDTDNHNKLLQFLMGLNDVYESTHDQILLMDPMPSVCKAYSMILRVEKQSDDSVKDLVEHSAYLVHFGGNFFPWSAGVYSNKGYSATNKKGDCYYNYCCKNNCNHYSCFCLHDEPD